jgi:hypothetical protein
MPELSSRSRGASLANRLNLGLREAACALPPGARRLPVLWGLTPRFQFTVPQESVLANLGQILLDSRRVYRYGNSVVLEMEEDGEHTLRPLAIDHNTEKPTASLLSNLLVCETPSANAEAPLTQFPVLPRLAELILNHEPTLQRLPRIKLYATRPVFDQNFAFCGPGWHADAQYLVHGPEVEPHVPDSAPTAGDVWDRLPPRLRELLHDFCFRSTADVVNAIGALLTGLLVYHFLRSGKPVIILDGNQSGVGKTLLARVLGVILDGKDPEAIHFTTNDEELAKRICSGLQDNPSSVLLIDNAKVRQGGDVNSPVLEANSTAPLISLRILGKSANYRRPNDLIWFITMNLTKASPDLVRRGLPVRFHHEGDPGERDFQDRDPIKFAERYRTEILGELAGMVVFWNQRGRPRGTKRHSLAEWAALIGGVLEANGLPEFLDNLAEAASEFNTELDMLAALAEVAMSEFRGEFVHLGETQPDRDFGCHAGNWEPLFRRANVLTDELVSGSARAKATRIGRFLGQHRDREVPIEQSGLAGTARLRLVEARSRQRRYYFEIRGELLASDEITEGLSELSDGLAESGVVQPVGPVAFDAPAPAPPQVFGDGRREDPCKVTLESTRHF